MKIDEREHWRTFGHTHMKINLIIDTHRNTFFLSVRLIRPNTDSGSVQWNACMCVYVPIVSIDKPYTVNQTWTDTVRSVEQIYVRLDAFFAVSKKVNWHFDSTQLKFSTSAFSLLTFERTDVSDSVCASLPMMLLCWVREGRL